MGESVVAEAEPSSAGVIGSFFSETGRSLKAVFGNRNLRRMQLGFAGSLIGSWAYGTAVTVWAYGVGGSKAVGIYIAIRLFLMAFLSPFAATFADRYPRRAVMICADAYCCLMVVAAAVCLLVGTPALPVFVLAILAALGGSPFRAASGALMPTLARTPEELTAANGTSSTLESLAFCLGPALAAVLLVFASLPAVFFFNAASFLWSMLMVLGIRVPAQTEPAEDASSAPEAEAEAETQAEEKESYLSEVSAGFRAIWRDKSLLLTVLEGSAQTIVAGAEGVLTVVLAVQILHTGPNGLGWLSAVMGVGSVIGGVYAISRASKRKLGQDLIAGVLLWSLPLLLVTIWPTPVTAFAAVALLGFGNPLVDVNLFTIIQRLTPDAVLGRVFGAMEAVLIGTMALGAAVTPWLLHVTDLRATLAIIGLCVGGLAVLGLPAMRRLDHRLEVPEGLPLLRAIPMFGPLNPVVMEELARALVPVEVAAGVEVMHEGDESDRFFVIESGLVEVTAPDGRVLRQEGAGDHFGEIGLLRDVPRTATITAVEDTRLLALERAEFLEAVTGQGEVQSLVEDVAARRLRA